MGVASTVRAQVKGVIALKQRLDAFQRKVTRTGMRAALTKATTPILRAVKQATPVRTGNLKKSMRRKVWTDTAKDVVGAVIGPKPGVTVTVTGKEGKPQKIIPSEYFHLVEFGHGGPHPSPPHPFMRPAFAAEKDATEKRFADGMKVEVEKAAKRLAPRRAAILAK